MVTNIYFKLRVTIPDVWFTTPEPISIKKTEQNTNIIVILRQSEETESESKMFIMCEAIANIKLSKNAAPGVTALLDGGLPAEYDLSRLSSDIRKSYGETGKIERYKIPKASLSPSIQNLLDETYKMLVEAIHNVLGIACWKFAQNAPIYTFRYGRMMWSANREEWKMTPVDCFVDASRPTHFWKDNEIAIQNLIDEDKNEPLSQELFREAWHQRGLNIRSALVIGITALETGIKDLIADLIPDSGWLIKEIPSPPVIKMLVEFFPKLPIRIQLEDKKLSFSEDVIKEIQKWNKQRNDIVHGKKIEIDFKKLEEFLLLVRDLLYLFDYLRGEEWALENIRESNRVKFINL